MRKLGGGGAGASRRTAREWNAWQGEYSAFVVLEYDDNAGQRQGEQAAALVVENESITNRIE
jgi:hypothetical protein